MAYTDSEDLNYLGQLYSVGARSTPFLNRIGNPILNGQLNPGVVSVTNSFEFSCAVPVDTGAGSQPSIDEATSVTGVTANTITRGQDTNTAQIFMRKAEVSYKKLSTTGTVNTGLNGDTVDNVTAGLGFEIANNPIMNELDNQVILNMKGMASDIDYSILRGTYQLAGSASTAAKTRGLATAISTNTTAAGSTDLTTTHVNATLKKMVDSGAPMMNIVAVTNSFNRQALGALYEYVPQSRTEGGSMIQKIYTDFAEIEILYDPNMVTSSIYFVEMSVLRLKCVPVNGQVFIVEDLATDGASYAKQLYTQLGLDYGPEEYHGSITGLTTS